MQVQIETKLGEVKHEYNDFNIELIAYKCKFMRASFQLTDHDTYEWVLPNELLFYDLSEADLSFVDYLLK